MKVETDEIILQGSPISKGIGIGFPVFFFSSEETPTSKIVLKDVEEEILRYRQALDLSRRDLLKLQKMSHTKGSSEIAAILGSHLEMMQDPVIEQEIEEKIRQTKQNTEWIFHRLIEDYKIRFSSIGDGYFQERIKDIIDISRRILGHLRPVSKQKIIDIALNSVVVTQELVPSETIEADSFLVSGFVTATGGLTSHSAIIARAKGIPYVANIDVVQLKNIPTSSIIVDGSLGIVIVNPKIATLQKYQSLKKLQSENLKSLKKASHFKAETIDGYEVKIFANLDNPKEMDLIFKNGASGIGLFRSEYLCLSEKRFLSEKEQFDTYKKMVKALKGKPLVIRIYDVGGDKKIDVNADSPDSSYFTSIGHEMNPALGCRAVRFLFRYPELLEAQIRAILRASQFGEIHLLIPMVSDLSEVIMIRKMVLQLQQQLHAQGIKTAKNIPVGSMIEVPSSALMCDAIAQESDFISIGTNDLVQYTLAADRANPHTSDLYFSAHPSVLRLIKQVVNHAKAYQKPVILCGEMAADPTLIPILIGFGISEFSVSPRLIPQVKSTVRKSRLLQSCKLADLALKQTSAQALKEFLEEASVSGA